MKNLSTHSHSLVARTEVAPGGGLACHLGVAWRFHLYATGLDQGAETPLEVFDLVSERYDARVVFDEALSKASAEFLAIGACHSRASEDQPVSVMIRVGEVSKRVAVYGDRQVNALGRIEGPAPFTAMPITPEKAFGGKGYAANPLGFGAPVDETTESRSLPNIELPNQLLEAGYETPEPAGFWPWPQEHPARLAMLGKFDDSWLVERWPHLPSDTQPAFYNQAPLDQRAAAFWQGGEPIEILNMHPEHAHIRSAIPRVRPRIFVVRQEGQEETFVELNTEMDTLWLLPDELTGILIARASVKCHDLDGVDIKAVYADVEAQDEAPKSLDAQYEAYLLAAGIKLPVEPEDASEIDEPEAANSPEKDVVAEADELIRQIAPPVLPPSDEELAVIKALQEDTAALERASEWADESMKRIDMNKYNQMVEDAMNKAFPPGTDDPEVVKATLRASGQQIAEVLKQTGMSEEALLAQMATFPEMAQLAELVGNTPGGFQGLLADIEQSMDELFALDKKLEELENAPPELETNVDEAAGNDDHSIEPTLTREWVVEHHAQGGSFAEMDLSELDLSNLMLKGAVFTGAVLTACDFRNTDLSNARFDGASVVGCDFSQAQLKFANMKSASVSESAFVSANLGFANLSDADLSDCRLPEVHLDKANATGASFNQSDLSGAVAPGLVADQAQFHDAKLAKADLQQARLTRAVFFNTDLSGANLQSIYAPRADFSSACATGADFSEAFLSDTEADDATDFSDTRFVGTNLEGASWAGPKLDGANLDGASLDNADLTGASMKGCRMIRAVAKNATLDKVTLHNADLSGINLFEGRLRGANIAHSKLEMGNFFGADFQDVVLDKVSFEGSDIGRTILSVRKALAK